jgi:hypothetical protein
MSLARKPCSSRSWIWKLALGVLLLAKTSAGDEVAQSEKTRESKRPERVGPAPDGRIVVPTNQVLKPAGRQVSFPGRPNDVALSPDRRLLAVLSQKEVLSIDVESGNILGRAKIRGASYKGIVFTPNGKQLFVSTSPTSRTDKKRGAIVRLLVQPDGTLQPGESISLGRSGGKDEANAKDKITDEPTLSADDVPAEDVQNDVQVEPRSFPGTWQQGNVPGPDLVGAGGEQFRLGVFGMSELVATLTNLLGIIENAIHGSSRAVINAFVEQGCVDLGRGLVHESW